MLVVWCLRCICVMATVLHVSLGVQTVFEQEQDVHLTSGDVMAICMSAQLLLM